MMIENQNVPLEITEESYNARIISLTYTCPHRFENPNCPLHEMRKKTFQEKVQWLNNLPLSEKQDLYHRHLVCFSQHQQ